MRLDHVSVTDDKQIFGSEHSYQIRAELQETPTSGWRTRFQDKWINTPEYRQISADVQIEGNQILFFVKDPSKVAASVKALKNVMKDADRGTDQPTTILAPAIRVAAKRTGRSVI